MADIEEPVVAAAARTPFESARRVFVIESVDTMNDQAANRMLKTLEEPPAFVHLLLLSRPPRGRAADDRLALPAGALRSAARRRASPSDLARRRSPSARRRARALALGDARLAARLASEEGEALRGRAEELVRAALAGHERRERPWLALLEAGAGGGDGGRRARRRSGCRAELELLPAQGAQAP